jgi:hypothetical protein
MHGHDLGAKGYEVHGQPTLCTYAEDGRWQELLANRDNGIFTWNASYYQLTRVVAIKVG